MTKNKNLNSLLEGCKCCGFAFLNWILVCPRGAWLELEKAKKHFADMKRD